MNYALRLGKLQKIIATLNCDVLLIEHPTHLYYLTGLEVSAGKLFVSSSSACLFVDGRYIDYCQTQTLYSVLPANESVIEDYLIEQSWYIIGFDKTFTSYQRFQELIQMVERISSILTVSMRIEPIDSCIKQLQRIKDTDEIRLLKEAAKLGFEGFLHIQALITTGITELELATELEIFWKKRGSSGVAFEPIIAFGSNSAMPHHHATSTILKMNCPVLIDCGVILNHYRSDMTRTLFFGSVSDEIKNIYKIVQEAKEKAMALCKPGTAVFQLDHAARNWIESKGYGKHFTHSLGHGIGLDTHEAPILRQTGIDRNTLLEEGMVITIEPGIYLQGLGGVRLEDTIAITASGYENFYPSTEP